VFRRGEAWLDEALGYLDDRRDLLAGLLGRHLPQVRYRPRDGTYLAWLDCTAMDLPDSPGALVTEHGHISVVERARVRRRGIISVQLRHAAIRARRDG
jgi:cysteine-S-conjugate beta-lyase